MSEHVSTGPLGDARVQEALRGLERAMSDLEAADWARLLEHDWGRRLVYRLVFEHGGAMEDPFLASDRDTTYRVGWQANAKVVLALLNAAFPDQMLLMHSEMTAARQADRAAKRRALSATTTDEG